MSRRKIHSQIAKIYDPMGFITPLTLEAKILVRRLVQDLNNKSHLKCKTIKLGYRIVRRNQVPIAKKFQETFLH